MSADAVGVDMVGKHVLAGDAGLETSVLDHAEEFVTRVAAEAPREYERLKSEGAVRQMLADDNAFNPGKLHVWAEFLVFRREFRRRFPEAPEGSCINAFCRLFLKNDISMSNLLDRFESGTNAQMRRLRKR